MNYRNNKIKSRKIKIVILAIICCSIATWAFAKQISKTSLANSPWPKFRADARNSSLGSGSGAKGIIKWTFKAKENINGSIAIGKNNTLYFSSLDGNMYAVDSKTGKKKWSFSGKFTSSTPAIAEDGTLYNCSEDGNLYALNGKTGKLLWKFKSGGSNRYSPTIGANKKVYFTSTNGLLYAINGNNGKKLWHFTPNKLLGRIVRINDAAHLQYDVAIGLNNVIYASAGDGTVYAINGTTGKEIWSSNVGGSIMSPAIGSDGSIYIAGSYYDLKSKKPSGIKICALSSKNGSIKWKTYVKGRMCKYPAIGPDGSVFVGVGMMPGGRLVALDGKTGKLKWEFKTGQLHYAPAIASDGTIYVCGGDSSEKVIAVNGKTGQKKWELLVNSSLNCSAAIDSDGTIYMGSMKGVLYAIR